MYVSLFSAIDMEIMFVKELCDLWLVKQEAQRALVR